MLPEDVDTPVAQEIGYWLPGLVAVAVSLVDLSEWVGRSVDLWVRRAALYVRGHDHDN